MGRADLVVTVGNVVRTSDICIRDCLRELVLEGLSVWGQKKQALSRKVRRPAGGSWLYAEARLTAPGVEMIDHHFFACLSLMLSLVR